MNCLNFNTYLITIFCSYKVYNFMRCLVVVYTDSDVAHTVMINNIIVIFMSYYKNLKFLSCFMLNYIRVVKAMLRCFSFINRTYKQ